MKEKNIREMARRMNLVSIDDMCQYTIAQLVVKIANKVNELVDEVWRFETDVQETLKTQNENIQYLLGEGLHLEIENIFDGWVKDGTFDTLLNHSALKKVNERIDETNAHLSELEINKADKSQTQSLQKQVDSLVIASGGDSSAEVIQARTSSIGLEYSVINGRLNAIEKTIITGHTTFEVKNLESGGIDGSGVNAPINSIIRTKDYIHFDYETEFKVRAINDEYGSRIFWYEKNGGGYNFVDRTEILETNIITTNPNYYYKITFFKKDSTAQIDTTIINNYEITLDTSKSNYIFEKIENMVITGYVNVEYSLSWENGSINSSTGEPAFFPTSVRTKEFYTPKVNGKMRFSCVDKTLGVKVYSYESNGDYITSSQSLANSVEIDVDSKYKYRFVLSKLETSESGNIAWGNTLKVELSKKPDYLKDEIEKAVSDYDKDMQNRIATAMIREKKRNPFEFKPLDKGYVSFVFDDLRFDIDLVASIFAEFDLPLCISAIPKNLTYTASGLKESSNGFTTGMKMKDVMTKVQSNGGEIFSHNGEVVTITNQYDFDFMYGYYVNNKKILEDNGFKVRGLISAGGTGSITKTDEIEKWLILNYDYSNQGMAGNYDKGRVNLNQPLETVKQIIADAKNNKKWVSFMAHTLSGQEANITESNLRAWLQYCKDIGIDVVTYAYIFDNYSSTKLENLLGANG